MERKRNRLEVIRDILQVIRNKNGRVKPTHILYKSNLSHTMMKEYIKELIDKKFITEENIEKGRTYRMTQKGEKYLADYSKLTGFMDSFGLS